MVKIYSQEAGNTLGCHKKFLKKLKGNDTIVVTDREMSDAIILFCPIVSRFQPDVMSAISNIPDSLCRKVILVAMHHTFDQDYAVPHNRQLDFCTVRLCVDCLFFEKVGLLKCPLNKSAVKAVRKELNISNYKPKCIRGNE